jgi:hypothetical protein
VVLPWLLVTAVRGDTKVWLMHLSDRERNTPKASGSPSAIMADRGARPGPALRHWQNLSHSTWDPSFKKLSPPITHLAHQFLNSNRNHVCYL